LEGRSLLANNEVLWAPSKTGEGKNRTGMEKGLKGEKEGGGRKECALNRTAKRCSKSFQCKARLSYSQLNLKERVKIGVYNSKVGRGPRAGGRKRGSLGERDIFKAGARASPHTKQRIEMRSRSRKLL